MYQRNTRTMSTRMGHSDQAKRAYQSRVWIGRGIRQDKEGHDMETILLVSSDNYWYINESKNGGIYGGFQLTGEYNIKTLAQHFQSVDESADKVNITLFFYDRDAKWIDENYVQRVNPDGMKRSFVATLYEKVDKNGKPKICGQIVRLM